MRDLGGPAVVADPRDRTAGQPASRVTRRASQELTARVAGAAMIGTLWVVLGVVARPIEQTCDPQLTRPVCLETIDAALRRGLPAIHPLLLTAHAEPGPAAEADQFGHRATVRFGLAAVPGPVSIRMFFDAGAHWGGIADRQAPELLSWSVGEGILLAGSAAGAWSLLRRRRGAATG